VIDIASGDLFCIDASCFGGNGTNDWFCIENGHEQWFKVTDSTCVFISFSEGKNNVWFVLHSSGVFGEVIVDYDHFIAIVQKYCPA